MKPPKQRSFSSGNKISMVLRRNLNRFAFWCQTKQTSLVQIRIKKSKNIKKKPERIKLNQNVFDIAVGLLQKRKESLSYIHESLFYGNDKQLLIYRVCNSIEKYLEKYRLPKEFKETLDPFIKLSETLYNLTIKKNIAISSLDLALTNKLQQ